jgi:hypothetical protein
MRPSRDASETAAGISERRFYDADGRLTEDAALAVRGEIVELDAAGVPVRRTSFLAPKADLSWLPVSEPAFLLWVLVALLALWLVIAAVLYLN